MTPQTQPEPDHRRRLLNTLDKLTTVAATWAEHDDDPDRLAPLLQQIMQTRIWALSLTPPS